MQISDRIIRPDKEATMWIVAIGISTAVTFILAYFCITAGIYNVFPHLFYITIVVASYVFPVAGVLYTILLSLGYIGIQFYLVPEAQTSILGIDTIIRTFAFISVSVVVSLTSSIIRKRGETYRALLAGSPSGIVLLSGAGKILEYNKVFADFFTSGPTDLIGRDIQSLTREPENLSVVLSSIEENKTTPAVIPFISKDTDTLWLHVTGSLNTDGSLIVGVSDFSLLKQAQEQRENDQLILLSLINNIPEPVWMRDAEGILLTANKRFFDITSKNPSEENVTTNISRIFSVSGDDRQVITTGVPYQSVETITVHNTEIRHITVKKSPILDASGAVIGMTGLAFDSTSQIRMQEEIRQREEQLQHIVGANPMGILVIDRERNVLLVNQALEILLGMEKKEIMQAKTIRELFGLPEDPPLLLEVMLEDEVDLALEQYFPNNYHPSPTVPGAFEVIEFFPLMDEGRGMFLRFTAARIITSAGDTYGAIATIENYTELQTITQTLEMSEERFKTAARIATDFIFEIDHATGMVSWFSDREMVILSGSLITSRPCHIDEIIAHIKQEDRERVAAAFSSHLTVKKPLFLEFQVLENSGQFRVWSLQAEVMPSRGRKDLRTIGVVSDITTKRLHEKRERDAFAAIEENIAQFAILGDHIRNPLQAISGYNDMREGDYKKEIQEQIVIVNKIVDQLDKGWIKSDSIREFLRRNYGLMDPKQTLYPDLEE